MSQQVRVEQDLVFAGRAGYTPNVKGIMMPELNIFDDHFTASYLEHTWIVEADNGSTAAAGTTLGGTVTITTDGSGAGCGELHRVAHWSPTNNCGMECRAKINTNTLVCVAIGFVDAYENNNDHIAVELESDDTLTTTLTPDAAVFIFDTSGSADVWFCACNANAIEGTPVAARGVGAPDDDTYARFRVQTDTDGNVTFYYNDTAVGYQAEAISHAATNMLLPYAAILEHSSSARILTVDRMTVWQDS